MKKKFFILALLLHGFLFSVSAQNMREIFIGMPDSIIPLMSRTNREDCADFIDAGMKACVTNRLDGKSEMLQLTSDYLKIKMSECSFLQMKLLPMTSGDTVVCVINTLCAEACDSRIRFFTKDWADVSGISSFFKKPMIEDFFSDKDSLERKMQISDMYLVEFVLSPLNDELLAKYTMPAYMTKEDSIFIAKSLCDIKYIWNGKTYEKSK